MFMCALNNLLFIPFVCELFFSCISLLSTHLLFMEMKNEPEAYIFQKFSWEKSLQKYNSHKCARFMSHIADTRTAQDFDEGKKHANTK